MPRFAITEKAGQFVGGQNNTGVGTVLTLSQAQAARDLRAGALFALDAPPATSKPAKDQNARASGAKKPAPRKGAKRS